MSTATIRLTTVCSADEIPVGLGRSFRIGGEQVAVFRSRSGKLFAVANRCPHRGGPLADGMLVGDQVVCPLHAFRFHSESGACDQAGVCSVSTYPVEVSPDGLVRVGLEVG